MWHQRCPDPTKVQRALYGGRSKLYREREFEDEQARSKILQRVRLDVDVSSYAQFFGRKGKGLLTFAQFSAFVDEYALPSMITIDSKAPAQHFAHCFFEEQL